MTKRNLFIIIGAILAVVFAVLHTLVPDKYALGLLAVLVAGLGGIYLGIGLSSKDRRKLVLQIVVTVFFIAFALLGLWISPLFLALAFFAHGVWDIVTVHPKCLNFSIVGWYMPVCVGYDFLFAFYILAWWYFT